jgi:hypothetical protein
MHLFRNMQEPESTDITQYPGYIKLSGDEQKKVAETYTNVYNNNQGKLGFKVAQGIAFETAKKMCESFVVEKDYIGNAASNKKYQSEGEFDATRDASPGTIADEAGDGTVDKTISKPGPTYEDQKAKFKCSEKRCDISAYEHKHAGDKIYKPTYPGYKDIDRLKQATMPQAHKTPKVGMTEDEINEFAVSQTGKRFVMKDGVKHKVIGVRDGQLVTEPVRTKKKVTEGEAEEFQAANDNLVGMTEAGFEGLISAANPEEDGAARQLRLNHDKMCLGCGSVHPLDVMCFDGRTHSEAGAGGGNGAADILKQNHASAHASLGMNVEESDPDIAAAARYLTNRAKVSGLMESLEKGAGDIQKKNVGQKCPDCGAMHDPKDECNNQSEPDTDKETEKEIDDANKILKKNHKDKGLDEFDEIGEDHVGFKALQGKLERSGKSKESAGAIAASIGNKKYGASAMHKAAASHTPLGENEIEEGADPDENHMVANTKDAPWNQEDGPEDPNEKNCWMCKAGRHHDLKAHEKNLKEETEINEAVEQMWIENFYPAKPLEEHCTCSHSKSFHQGNCTICFECESFVSIKEESGSDLGSVARSAGFVNHSSKITKSNQGGHNPTRILKQPKTGHKLHINYFKSDPQRSIWSLHDKTGSSVASGHSADHLKHEVSKLSQSESEKGQICFCGHKFGHHNKGGCKSCKHEGLVTPSRAVHQFRKNDYKERFEDEYSQIFAAQQGKINTTFANATLNWLPEEEALDEGKGYEDIGPGDHVKFNHPLRGSDKIPQQGKGRVVMKGPAGWVLNTGGKYGTPAIVSPENYVSHRKAKKRMTEDEMIDSMVETEIQESNNYPDYHEVLNKHGYKSKGWSPEHESSDEGHHTYTHADGSHVTLHSNANEPGHFHSWKHKGKNKKLVGNSGDSPKSLDSHLKGVARAHRSGEARKDREATMKSLGLNKVKGSVSGKTYWESEEQPVAEDEKPSLGKASRTPQFWEKPMAPKVKDAVSAAVGKPVKEEVDPLIAATTGYIKSEVDRAGGPTDLDEWKNKRSEFANPGSALRAASKSNPRNLPCPTCKQENKLTPKDKAKGYQCDDCANMEERGW